jgi:hypothetical protein
MVKIGLISYWMTSIDGASLVTAALSYFVTNLPKGSLQYPLSQAFADFPMVAVSSSGRGMIQRHL